MTDSIGVSFLRTEQRFMQYVYVNREEIQKNKSDFQMRFKDCLKFTVRQSFHRFISISEYKIKCVKFKSQWYEEMVTSRTFTISLWEEDIIRSIYDWKYLMNGV